MKHSIAHVAPVVRDSDEAIAFRTDKLRFAVVEDIDSPEQEKRWVAAAPAGSDPAAGGISLPLARAAAPEQARFVGDQAGGRVFLFRRTDDVWRDRAGLQVAGVDFVRPPTHAPYGTVAVFVDLHGNRWDLVEFTTRA